MNATGPASGPQVFVVSPDGRYLFLLWALPAVNGRDGPTYLQRWPVDPPGAGIVRPTVIPLGSEHGMVAAGATPDGRLVIATDGAVTTWNATRTLHRVARQAVQGMRSTFTGAVSPDGRSVGYGEPDGTVHFVDVATGATTDGSGAHAAGVISLAFSPDSRVAVTTGDDGLAIVWDPATGSVVERLSGHGGRVIGVGFAGNSTLFTSSLDGTVLQWDLSGAHRFGTPFHIGLAAIPGSALPAALSPDGRVLAVQVGDHGVRLFSVRSLRQTGEVSIGERATVSSVAWSGDRLLVGTSTGAIHEFAGRAPRQVAVLRGLTEKVNALAGSPDGHLVAAVDGVYDQYGLALSGTLAVWRDGRLLRSGRLASPGNAVAFSRDGALLAVAKDSPNAKDSGPSVLVFDARSGRLLRSMRPKTGTISLAFGTGDELATGSWQGIITLWNAGSGAPLGKEALAAPAPVSSVAFDPSGTRYATAGGSSGGLRLWDTATQQLIGAQFPGGDGQWGTVAFTPDGRYLLVVFTDGSAYRWPVSVEGWEAHACAVAGRNLTKEEWHRYVGSRGYQSTCPMFPPGT
jgi:WD40 repeat protein